jgi:hypothetical protein
MPADRTRIHFVGGEVLDADGPPLEIADAIGKARSASGFSQVLVDGEEVLVNPATVAFLAGYDSDHVAGGPVG